MAKARAERRLVDKVRLLAALVARLTTEDEVVIMTVSRQLDPSWQKARIAARIIVKSRKKKLHARDRRLARWLADQPGVTNRLIEQGVASVQAPWRFIQNEYIYRPRAVAASD